MTRMLMEMSILEAAHLTDLVDQFAELIAETVDSDTIDDDEAVALQRQGARPAADRAGEVAGQAHAVQAILPETRLLARQLGPQQQHRIGEDPE